MADVLAKKLSLVLIRFCWTSLWIDVRFLSCASVLLAYIFSCDSISESLVISSALTTETF